mgnify:CR=1 FL=1
MPLSNRDKQVVARYVMKIHGLEHDFMEDALNLPSYGSWNKALGSRTYSRSDAKKDMYGAIKDLVQMCNDLHGINLVKHGITLPEVKEESPFEPEQ